MRISRLATLMLTSCAVLACDENDHFTGIGAGDTATVRFVNASNATLDFASDGGVTAGNGNVPFGGASTCLVVDVNTGNLIVRQSGTTAALPGFSTASLSGGGNFTVVAYAAPGGGTSFTTLSNSFTPASSQSGARLFNAVPTTSFDVHVTAPGAALGTASATNVTFGAASSFFNVPAGPQQVRLTNAGTTTVVSNIATQTFVVGERSTLIVAPAAAGTTTLRTFFVTAC